MGKLKIRSALLLVHKIQSKSAKTFTLHFFTRLNIIGLTSNFAVQTTLPRLAKKRGKKFQNTATNECLIR